MPATNQRWVGSRQVAIRRMSSLSLADDFRENRGSDWSRFETDEMQWDVLDEAVLGDYREVECRAEAQFSHYHSGAGSSMAVQQFIEASRLQKNPFHFSSTIGGMVDVLVVLSIGLAIPPTEFCRFDHGSRGRSSDRIHSLQEPGYNSGSSRPAIRIARILWAAVTPDPQ